MDLTPWPWGSSSQPRPLRQAIRVTAISSVVKHVSTGLGKPASQTLSQQVSTEEPHDAMVCAQAIG